MKVFYILTIVPLAFLLPGKHFLIETDDQELNEIQGLSPSKTRNNVGKRVKSQNKASWIPPEDCEAPDGKMYCTGCEVIIDNCNICECRNNKLENCKKTCPDCEFGDVKEGDTYHLGDIRWYARHERSKRCNHCTCQNGRPTNCTQLDCEKKNPGCVDMDGKMQKHDDRFRSPPNGDFSVCDCFPGQAEGCVTCTVPPLHILKQVCPLAPKWN